ncbi:MAG TPA: thiol reductase thioredoxin, partial [Pseudomonadota bacterium]|nr:thiol reductase thioredoxin [Pseudomonadota bacterium]
MLSRPRGRLVTLSALSVALFSVQLASAKRTAEKPVVAKRATAESAPAVSAPASVLPFVENDFALARAQALKSGKLLFVDAWALWCHTCLSMRNFVFTDVQL